MKKTKEEIIIHEGRKLKNHQVSEVNNGIAKAYREKLRIFGEDGKIWALFDKSWGKIEFETVDPVKNNGDALRYVKEQTIFKKIMTLKKEGKL